MAASLIRRGSGTRGCPLLFISSRTSRLKLKSLSCCLRKAESTHSSVECKIGTIRWFSVSAAATPADHQKKAVTSSPMTVAETKSETHSDIRQDDDVLRVHYIPITRQSLIRRLVEEKDFLTDEERKLFPDFVRAMDTALVNKYHGILEELKVLFDPLNPDKDTLKSRESTRREKLDTEYVLLQHLDDVLTKAHFQELPAKKVEDLLKGHETQDKVRVSVDLSRYDVLRFWVFGHEVPDLHLSFSERILSRLLRPRKPLEFYKRVVVALRLKKDSKLSLKAFKDVPVQGIEMLVPDGRIHMRAVDKGILISSVCVAGFGVLAKIAGVLVSLQLDWALVFTLVGGAVALRVWSSYTERRNSYLVDVSRLLYFKNLASNRSLLTMLVDRAEDENLKGVLLTYAFLQTSKPYDLRNNVKSPFITLPPGGLSKEELESEVKRWLRKTAGVRTEFDSTAAVATLNSLGILCEKQNKYHVLQLDAASRLLPQSPQSVIPQRATEADVTEGYDRDEYLETVEEYKAEDHRMRRYGWF